MCYVHIRVVVFFPFPLCCLMDLMGESYYTQPSNLPAYIVLPLLLLMQQPSFFL